MARTIRADGSGIEVEITVDGIELDEQRLRVTEMYAQNLHTFIRKNADYGGSFENSAKLESIMRHGEVREDELFDIIAQQILVRGFYDKLSRFHQLQIQDNGNRVGEEIEDTLLDLGNYALMLAAMREKYESGETNTVEMQFASDCTWSKEDVAEFMEEFDTNESGS